MDLTDIFVDEKLDEKQIENMKLVRLQAWDLARAIRDCSPSCQDQAAALRAVREAAFWAMEAIRIRGAV